MQIEKIFKKNFDDFLNQKNSTFYFKNIISSVSGGSDSLALSIITQKYCDKNKIPHFIFDLVKKILRGKYYNEKVELWGDGNQTREIIHVNDFIYNMYNLEKNYKNEIFNIGGGVEKSIKFFAKKICQRANYDFEKIIFNKTKYVGAKSKKLSINKILKINPLYKKKLMNLKKGINEMVDWHLKNKEF